MFPFVRRELDAFLNTQWHDADVQAARQQIVDDTGGQIEIDLNSIRHEVLRLMDDDVKATGLRVYKA
jgi:methionine salvage enolase-phosphatase E1